MGTVTGSVAQIQAVLESISVAEFQGPKKLEIPTGNSVLTHKGIVSKNIKLS